ncbi:hypothetical protein [Legionella sp. CNM-4043-24]|uniref:hypothetical protein n=1 Tax=Legionella sp. CNM-4043-24 TaxID=3421646 RepID=UPI00403B365B
MTVRVLSFYLNPLQTENHNWLQQTVGTRQDYSRCYTMAEGATPTADIVASFSEELTAIFDSFQVSSIWSGSHSPRSHAASSTAVSDMPLVDASCLLPLYAQIQKAACAHPREQIDFDCFIEPHLQDNLRRFFTSHPDMLPRNVRLRLVSDSTEEQEVIPGSGVIDWNYHQSVRDMARLSREQQSDQVVLHIQPGHNFIRKNPTVTQTLKGSLKEVQSTDMMFAAHMSNFVQALRELPRRNFTQSECELLDTAIWHYGVMATPTDLWQICLPEKPVDNAEPHPLDVYTQEAINQIFMRMQELTDDKSLSRAWADRLTSYYWVVCNLEKLSGLIQKNTTVVTCLQSSLGKLNEVSLARDLVPMPYQRLTKLPLFTQTWVKQLGEGFLPGGHPVLQAVTVFNDKMTQFLVSVNEVKGAQETRGLHEMTISHDESAADLTRVLLRTPSPDMEQDEPISTSDILEQQSELATEALADLKSIVLDGLDRNFWRVRGGLFAGTVIQLDDGTSRRVPAHIAGFWQQIRRAENDVSESYGAAVSVIKMAMLAASAPHRRRAEHTRQLYDSIFDVMSVDINASLNAMLLAFVGKDRRLWKTRWDERPTTVVAMQNILYDEEMAPAERLKRILTLTCRAELSNGRLFNFRSDNTKNFYASLPNCLVFKEQPALDAIEDIDFQP